MKRNFTKSFLVVFVSMFIFLSLAAQTVFADSAGLAWGPKDVGNLRFYLTNIHTGWAGPKFPSSSTPHVNFHVDIKNGNKGYKPLNNFHIVKYTMGKKDCIYVYDSETKRTVFDNCFTNWTKAAQEAAQAIKNFTNSLLKKSDIIATIAIWLIIIALIIIMILGMGAVAFA